MVWSQPIEVCFLLLLGEWLWRFPRDSNVFLHRAILSIGGALPVCRK